jgi:hypothetical protein
MKTANIQREITLIEMIDNDINLYSKRRFFNWKKYISKNELIVQHVYHIKY